MSKRIPVKAYTTVIDNDGEQEKRIVIEMTEKEAAFLTAIIMRGCCWHNQPDGIQYFPGRAWDALYGQVGPGNYETALASFVGG